MVKPFQESQFSRADPQCHIVALISFGPLHFHFALILPIRLALIFSSFSDISILVVYVSSASLIDRLKIKTSNPENDQKENDGCREMLESRLTHYCSTAVRDQYDIEVPFFAITCFFNQICSEKRVLILKNPTHGFLSFPNIIKFRWQSPILFTRTWLLFFMAVQLPVIGYLVTGVAAVYVLARQLQWMINDR